MALNLEGFRRFRAGLPEALAEANRETAEQVGDLAQQLAPEDTGDLKASKQVLPGEEPGTFKVSFGGEGTGVDYAKVVEYGDPSNPNYPAQPYLTPAAKEIDHTQNVKLKLQALASRSRV